MKFNWIIALIFVGFAQNSLAAQSGELSITFSSEGLRASSEEPLAWPDSIALILEVLDVQQQGKIEQARFLRAGIEAAEKGMPISALRIVDFGLAVDEGELHGQLHDLAARVHASLGEMAWAYRHQLAIEGAARGASSNYWLCAYVGFQDRVQFGLVEERAIQPVLPTPEALALSDELWLIDEVGASFWNERFEICAGLGLASEAGLAAAWSLLLGSEDPESKRLVLEMARTQAVELIQQSKEQPGDSDTALAQALAALSLDPIEPQTLKAVHGIAVEAGDDELAVSVLGMRWKAGDKDFDLATTLPRLVQQGDFSLLLSIAADRVQDVNSGWEAPYYLALAARAWNLPHLESNALRALADTGYCGGIYHMPRAGLALDPVSDDDDRWLKALSREQAEQIRLAPLEEALVWWLEGRDGKRETIFPRELLERLSKANASDQLHVAFLLGLIDRAKYEQDCVLPHEKAVRAGVLALYDGLGTDKAQERLVGLLGHKEANGSLKALAHGHLASKNNLSPPKLRSVDRMFGDPAKAMVEQLIHMRHGGVFVPELPLRPWLEKRGDFKESPLYKGPDLSARVVFMASSRSWPQAGEAPLWVAWDPRFPAMGMTAETRLQDEQVQAELADLRDRWLLRHFSARPLESNASEVHRRVVLLVNSISASHMYPERDNPVNLAMMSRQIARVTGLIKELESSGHLLEANMLAGEYAFSDAFGNSMSGPLGEYAKKLTPGVRKGLQEYAKSKLSNRYKDARDVNNAEELVRATASSLCPPSNPRFASVVSMVRNHRPMADIQAEVARGLEKIVTGPSDAELERQRRREASTAAFNESLKYRQPTRAGWWGGQRDESTVSWSTACAMQLKARMRKPTIIKNYNANGTITIITRR